MRCADKDDMDGTYRIEDYFVYPDVDVGIVDRDYIYTYFQPGLGQKSE
jgi:hypothetical protein